MFDPKDFISRKKDVIKHFKKEGVTTDTVSNYCSLAGIPLTVAYGFIAEDLPEYAEFCKEKIRELNSFYGVKEKTCGFCSEKCDNEYCITEE